MGTSGSNLFTAWKGEREIQNENKEHNVTLCGDQHDNVVVKYTYLYNILATVQLFIYPN